MCGSIGVMFRYKMDVGKKYLCLEVPVVGLEYVELLGQVGYADLDFELLHVLYSTMNDGAVAVGVTWRWSQGRKPGIGLSVEKVLMCGSSRWRKLATCFMRWFPKSMPCMEK